MIILLVGVMFLTRSSFYFPHILFSIIPIFSLFIMTTGLGLMLSIVCVYYTDVLHLWTVVSMMLMYASAIFYPLDIIPEPYRQLIMLNPILWIIDQFRYFIFVGSIPQLSNIINSLLLSFILLILGIIVFKKYEQNVTMKL